MVGVEPQTICAAQGRWPVDAGWAVPGANGPKLQRTCAAAVLESAAVHAGRTQQAPDSTGQFREAGAFISSQVHRLGRFREAGEDETQAAEGSHATALG